MQRARRWWIALWLTTGVSCATSTSSIRDHHEDTPQLCGVDTACPISDGGAENVSETALGLAAVVSLALLLQWYVQR